jgi:methylenetetrahydrofolate--tRNA-(uracil-5-)-methyltransferase
MDTVKVIGGGLAGCEAAWYLAENDFKVELYEARPVWKSPAHKTEYLGELVCSNSLKTSDKNRPSGILKEELKKLNSLLMKLAEKHSVPAGKALAVDREKFGQDITKHITSHPNIKLIREEIKTIPEGPAIIATGPLTSKALFDSLSEMLGKSLYFYDAIAPVVEFDSIDPEKSFNASRWDNGEGYINCPLNKEEYILLVEELLKAEKVLPHEFEKPVYFESCLPVEVMAARGLDVLRHGPLRPVGLRDPQTGETPWAVVQLRTENRYNSSYNLVGFQTRMTYGEQKRVLKLIPALKNCSILKYGEIHRNTFVDTPRVLKNGFEVPQLENVYLAGLLLGVEGYVESMATGLFAAIKLSHKLKSIPFEYPPATTSIGGLLNYLKVGIFPYQPTNINFGLWPPLEKSYKKREKRIKLIERAIIDFDSWISKLK